MIAQVDITPVKSIKFTSTGGDVHHIPKQNIVAITSSFIDLADPAPPAESRQPLRDMYHHGTITKIHLHLVDGTTETFECQDVANQLTWNGGAQADLNAAEAAINASL